MPVGSYDLTHGSGIYLEIGDIETILSGDLAAVAVLDGGGDANDTLGFPGSIDAVEIVIDSTLPTLTASMLIGVNGLISADGLAYPCIKENLTKQLFLIALDLSYKQVTPADNLLQSFFVCASHPG